MGPGFIFSIKLFA